MSDGLLDKAPFRRLMEARERNNLAAIEKKKAGEAKAEAELAVYELLVDSDVVGEFSLDLGPPWGVQGFTHDSTIYGRVLDKDLAVHSLRMTGHDDILVREQSVAEGRLNEHVRDLLETGQPIPDGIDFNDRKRVKVSAKKKKGDASV